MASWTTEHEVLLSCLLDDVTGTDEIVQLRKDKCLVHDCLRTFVLTDDVQSRWYFTGSKSEGLELAGSDEDYMLDINGMENIHVFESVQQLTQSSKTNKFLLVPDNEYPGFAFLRCVLRAYHCKFYLQSLHDGSDDKYLGSESFLLQYKSKQSDALVSNIQGPSLETWFQYQDKSETGFDMVPSIRCEFWPSTATEWFDRPRKYGWPSLRDINTIVSFGFHIVAVGHHLSPMKSLQWRISCSIAERTLVWSFNHRQIQCYAFMKLILKEFIKIKSSEGTKGVLCSYFIKTFLFWQYEETDPTFWQSKNLRGCILFLLRKFSKCIRDGVLRHYFIPTFNLLEVKLTGVAKVELLQLYDVVIQFDMAIMSKCPSMVDVWSCFLRYLDSNQSEIIKMQMQARYRFDHDIILLRSVNCFQNFINFGYQGGTISNIYATLSPSPFRYEYIIPEIVNLLQKNLVKSPLATFVLRGLYCSVFKLQVYFPQHEHISHYHLLGNSFRKVNILGNDISSSRLWCATFLQQNEKYSAAIRVIDNVLSAIPPYALYYSKGNVISSDISKLLYRDTLLTGELNHIERAKQAWLFDIVFDVFCFNFVPGAIRIELIYLSQVRNFTVSPFTYAYYLKFLCYHGLGQYENRDNALRQLAGTVSEPPLDRCSSEMHFSYNIVGHCFLMAGQIDMARLCFQTSIFCSSLMGGAYDEYNSAYHYLSYL